MSSMETLPELLCHMLTEFLVAIEQYRSAATAALVPRKATAFVPAPAPALVPPPLEWILKLQFS